MSYQGRSRTKNRFHEANKHKQYISIANYVERLEERKQCPARIVNGEMEILFHGHWVTPEEFDKCLPEPIVISFSFDATNVDKTRAFLI